jgi:hypothetical protein
MPVMALRALTSPATCKIDHAVVRECGAFDSVFARRLSLIDVIGARPERTSYLLELVGSISQLR